LVLGCLQAACTTAGPVTVRTDRFNYNMAGAESTKEQILLNIVRLRYGEPIYFLEISSMLSQYQIDAAAHTSYRYNSLDTLGPSLRAAYNLRGENPNWWREYGGSVGYSDRPTISYSPVLGEQFAQQVMSPIPPTTLIQLAHSGWSIDRLMACCVQQINEVRNESMHDARIDEPPSTEQFRRLSALFQKLQDSGELRFSVEPVGDQPPIYLYTPIPSDKNRETITEIRALLGYGQSEAQKFRLVQGLGRTEPNDLAIETRSVLATMYALAQRISVPPEHIRQHEIPAPKPVTADSPERIWLRVNFSRLPTLDPFAQVFHNGYWYYIDKSDWSSKRTFALLTYLFSLQATVQGQTSPLVTVGAGR
jgi:hypothetical protein